jgi:hypothetical protein
MDERTTAIPERRGSGYRLRLDAERVSRPAGGDVVHL